MPGASGGLHGYGVDRHSASALDPFDPDAFSSRRETEGKATCSHATALTLSSSAGVVVETCWKSARKASEERAGGGLTVKKGVTFEFLEPTDFSPMK